MVRHSRPGLRCPRPPVTVPYSFSLGAGFPSAGLGADAAAIACWKASAHTQWPRPGAADPVPKASALVDLPDGGPALAVVQPAEPRLEDLLALWRAPRPASWGSRRAGRRRGVWPAGRASTTQRLSSAPDVAAISSPRCTSTRVSRSRKWTSASPTAAGPRPWPPLGGWRPRPPAGTRPPAPTQLRGRRPSECRRSGRYRRASRGHRALTDLRRRQARSASGPPWPARRRRPTPGSRGR